MPKVSVIVPAYNQGSFLQEAAGSVLAQGFEDYEIIVVDDGSTDDTARVAQGLCDRRVRYIRQDNRGVAAARNAGVAASGGSYLAFLDSDDAFCQGKLQLQARALDNRPELGMVIGGYQYIDRNGAVIGEERQWLDRRSLDLESLLMSGFGPPSTVLLQRDWFERVGGFDPDRQLSAAEDMDLWYRLSFAGCQMEFVPAIVCRYRIHGSNASRSVRRHYQALHSALDRLFANTDLPDSVRRRRNEVYASKRLAEAGKLCGAGDLPGGKGALEAALMEDPTLLAGGAERLISQIVAWEDSIWADDGDGLVHRFLHDLPPDLVGMPDFSLRVCRTRDKARFYRAFRQGDNSQVRRLWIMLARSEPSWLLNRGNWSMLLRSLG